MNRTIRITGLILASLTISTVAMAQSAGGNGGGGGAGGGADGGGGDNSVIALRLQDHERARLSRAQQLPRPGANCVAGSTCNEPPPPPNRRPAAEMASLNESCSGGEYLVIRNRAGQVVRYVCETR